MNSKDSFVWTPAHIAILKRLWDAGKTASEIAEALGKGVSRNSVLGKVHRLGLHGRGSPIGKRITKAPRKPTAFQRKPVAARPNANGFAWTPENITTLRALWAQDKRPAQISAHFGFKVSAAAIANKACKLGLPKRLHLIGQPSEEAKAAKDQAPQRRDLDRPDRLSVHFKAVTPGIAGKTADFVVLDDIMGVPLLPIPEPANKFDGRPLPLYDLGPGQCRFAVTPHQAALHLFCGEPIRPGSRYCEAHHAVVYVPYSQMRSEEKAA